MITVSGTLLNMDSISSDYPKGSIERKILSILSSSTENYKYSSLSHLIFELEMRKSIVISAREFDASQIKFKTFKKSTCNTDYWKRTEEGGFLLKENVTPAEGIKDIFRNGAKYGTECSTAIIILYYKALLNIYSEELFNKTFPNLQLMNWHYIHDDLDVYTQKQDSDFLPGDCRYFENPDYDKNTREWQGENAIDLGNGYYFGHGIGISNPEGIIKVLNKHRNQDSSTPAFLTNYVTLPNFKRLADIYLDYNYRRQFRYYRQCFRCYNCYYNSCSFPY